ncbi:HelD family protein [Salana multivorans]
MVHTAPPYNATKDQEQTWFEDLAEVREAKRDSLSRAHTSAANPKDRAALRAAADPSRTLGPADEPVAFLRVDLNEGGPFYIGRHGLRDEDRNPVVLEWATPVALQYRGASHEDPRGVVRHRSFRTDEEGGRPNEILEFDDVVLADLARQVAALGKSGVDVIEGDDFLQDVLAQGRTPDMADIVRTIQAAQADIIRAPGQQLLVVQGGPGTGKTAIAVHRAAALTHPEATDPADRVLIVGPSRALLHYIRQVSHDLGGERVVGSTVDQLMSSDVTISDRDIEPSGAAALKGSAVMASVLDNALRDRIRVPDSEHEIALDEVGFGVPVIPRDVKEILEGIDAFPYIAGRERFRLVLESHVVTAARLSGQPLHRGWSARADRSSIEAFVDRVWPSLSAQAFLRDLYGSVDRLISAAGTLLNGEQIRLLRRQASPRLSEQLWSREDLPLLDYVSRQLREPSDTLRFDHIIIDEAQDLSAMAMNAIHSRSRTGAMTAVGDIAQSTGPAARDSWDELLDGLAPNSARSLTQLRYGYRVPAAVLEFASLLLPDAAPGVERPAVVIRSDHEPEASRDVGRVCRPRP